MLVLAALVAIPILVGGCAPGVDPVPTAAAVATQAAPTVAAAATQAAPTAAAVATQVAPTAAVVATQVAPTAAAVATQAAPAVATAVAPLATPAAKAATTTAGQLADQGRAVYATSCAGCHGAQGEGGTAPALIGQNVTFPRFSTAQDLLGYITQRMPANHPGSLSAEQYLQATAYILVENRFVQRDAPLSSALLGGIQLTR
jgi:mono/diheme cytochrome c family protein